MANDRDPSAPGGRRGTTRGDQTQAGSGRSTPKRDKHAGRVRRSTALRRLTVTEIADERVRPPVLDPFTGAPRESLRGPHPTDRFLPLREDHQQVEEQLEALRTRVIVEPERTERWAALATALEAHAHAEEEVVYPHLEELAGIDQAREHHARMRALIGRLDALAVGPDYRECLDELAAVIREHVELEEQLLFPIAEQRLGAGEVDRVVAEFIRRERQIRPGIESRRRRG